MVPVTGGRARRASLGGIGQRRRWHAVEVPDVPHHAAPHRARALLQPSLAEGEVSRSEEHTSELQSLAYLVCRLLLEKKKKKTTTFSVTVHDITATTMASLLRNG